MTGQTPHYSPVPPTGRETIYVASSWKNLHYPSVVEFLREKGRPTYDFRAPSSAFRWKDCPGAPKTVEWTAEELVTALNSSEARAGFESDYAAMCRAYACVLVLPCGRSAHLEAGWFTGRGVPLIVYSPDPAEPELMYLLDPSVNIVSSLYDLETAVSLAEQHETSRRLREAQRLTAQTEFAKTQLAADQTSLRFSNDEWLDFCDLMGIPAVDPDNARDPKPMVLRVIEQLVKTENESALATKLRHDNAKLAIKLNAAERLVRVLEVQGGHDRSLISRLLDKEP